MCKCKYCRYGSQAGLVKDISLIDEESHRCQCNFQIKPGKAVPITNKEMSLLQKGWTLEDIINSREREQKEVEIWPSDILNMGHIDKNFIDGWNEVNTINKLIDIVKTLTERILDLDQAIINLKDQKEDESKYKCEACGGKWEIEHSYCPRCLTRIAACN